MPPDPTPAERKAWREFRPKGALAIALQESRLRLLDALDAAEQREARLREALELMVDEYEQRYPPSEGWAVSTGRAALAEP